MVQDRPGLGYQRIVWGIGRLRHEQDVGIAAHAVLEMAIAGRRYTQRAAPEGYDLVVEQLARPLNVLGRARLENSQAHFVPGAVCLYCCPGKGSGWFLRGHWPMRASSGRGPAPAPPVLLLHLSSN